MYRLVCELDRLKATGRMRVMVADRPLLVAYHEGKVYALSDICPHMGASLSAGTYAAGKVTCPRHHARFDVRNGEVKGKAQMLFLKLPTQKATTYPARIENDHVYIDM
jgi:3-phenylpropionate/trans-cinnamate dioxygenase ferredoxin subunit